MSHEYNAFILIISQFWGKFLVRKATNRMAKAACLCPFFNIKLFIQMEKI